MAFLAFTFLSYLIDWLHDHANSGMLACNCLLFEALDFAICVPIY